MSDLVESIEPVPDRELSTRSDIIGRGPTFPVAFDSQGGMRLTSGDDVEASIYLIIMTVPGERVMRPEFGCEIWSHLYAPINASTLGQMAHAVRQALARWEPRIEVEEIRVVPRRGADAIVDIHVEYLLRDTNDRRNLVFPFYTIPGEA